MSYETRWACVSLFFGLVTFLIGRHAGLNSGIDIAAEHFANIIRRADQKCPGDGQRLLDTMDECSPRRTAARWFPWQSDDR